MRKVLIVVHDFPGTGGLRFFKFVQHLPRLGYQPVVLSVRSQVEIDEAANRSLEGVRVYRTFCLRKSPFRVFSKLFNAWSLTVYFERLFFIPDLFVTWVPSAVARGYRLIKEGGIDLVVTTSPPESIHLIGLLLKRLTGVKWIADFQDLWTTKAVVYRPPTSVHDGLIRRLERKIYASCDHLISNTRNNVGFYTGTFGLDSRKITVIPNGYDAAEKPTIPYGGNGQCPGVFTIGYMGYFDKQGFPWKELLLAIKKLAGQEKKAIQLRIAGHVSNEARAFVEKEGLAPFVTLYGNLPHPEAFQLIARTDLLLVLMFETPYSKAVVPHKLYYYLTMGKPILAIAEEGGEVADIVSRTNTGKTFSANGAVSIERAIGEYYEEWRQGPIRYMPRPKEIEAYEYGTLTQTLKATMDRVTDHPHSSSAHDQPTISPARHRERERTG